MWLERLNVLGLPALGAFYDVELNSLTFLEGAKAVTFDRGVMYENIIARRTAEKSELADLWNDSEDGGARWLEGLTAIGARL